MVEFVLFCCSKKGLMIFFVEVIELTQQFNSRRTVLKSKFNYGKLQGVWISIMDNNSLRLAIENEKFDEAEIILEEISRSKDIQAIPLLIEYLQRTENALLRNSIALTLSDIGNEEVVQPLIDVINDPKTLGYRGTLLYALEPFDCSAHLETLIYHLINGNFEVQAQAYQLIESTKGEISDEVLLNCIIEVKEELNEIERQMDIMSDTLETLFAFKKK